VKSGGVQDLLPIPNINQTVMSLKLNSMLSVTCYSLKLMPNLRAYVLTKHQCHKHTCHNESYGINIKLREARG
jgi:hypothetical protein